MGRRRTSAIKSVEVVRHPNKVGFSETDTSLDFITVNEWGFGGHSKPPFYGSASTYNPTTKAFEGFLRDYPKNDWDGVWDGRRQNMTWRDVGNGRWEFLEKIPSHIAGGAPGPVVIPPVICTPGAWLKISLTPNPERGFSQGSLVPMVSIGSARSGAQDGGNYTSLAFSRNVQRIDNENILVRVPLGAKSGPLRIFGRKGVTTWVGKRRHIDSGWVSHGDAGVFPIPIIVMTEAQPLCEEAYQMGRTNVDNLEGMVNPYGAITNAGDTVQIGANGFDGFHNHKKSPFSLVELSLYLYS